MIWKRSSKVFAGIVGAAAAALVVTACGQADATNTATPTRTGVPALSGPGSAAPVTAAAFTRTMARHTAMLAVVEQASVNDMGVRPGPATYRGTIDFAARSSDLVPPPDPTAATDGFHVGSGEARYVHTMLYENVNFGQGAKNKPWMALDVYRLARQHHISVDQLPFPTPFDPVVPFGLLHGAVREQAAGPVTMNGAPATSYTVTVDLSRVGDDPAVSPIAAGFTREFHVTSLQITVAVDQQGLIRGISLAEPTRNESGGTEPATDTITEVLSDFGSPVTVGAPDAGQVTDVTDATDKALNTTPGGH